MSLFVGVGMASKRSRGTSWEFSVKRKGLLPKPITLTFDTEAEGDAYCAHLEKLLDAGIVPDEFKTRAKAITTVSMAIRQYMAAAHITDDDVGLLNVMERGIGARALDQVNYIWAEAWVRTIVKTHDGLAKKSDLDTLELKLNAKLESMELRLTIKLGAFLSLAVGVLIAVLRMT